MKWIYQLYEDGPVFTSYVKAHTYLAKSLSMDPEKLLVSKSILLVHGKPSGGLMNHYFNGHSIYKRPLNPTN